MVAQSIASRSRRPPQPDPDDVLLARLLFAVEWARKNIVAVTSGVVVVLLLIGGIFWYRADQRRKAEEAAVAFLPVEQAVLGSDPTVATRELELFVQRHGSTEYGDEARVLLAQMHLRAGKTAEAIEVAAPVAADLDSPVGPQAALLSAAAQEAAGQGAEAIQTYLRVADHRGSRFHQEEALLGAARLQEMTNDLTGAATSYRRLIEMTEDPAEKSLYEMRLTEVEARAAATE
jgi:predicted negative regulator of RcsB-dependent stress response